VFVLYFVGARQGFRNWRIALPSRKKTVSEETRLEWIRLLSLGWTRADIARRYGKTRQFVSRVVGPQPPQPEKKEKIIYVSVDAWDKAVEIAEERNLRLRSGENAGQGSVGALVEQIGRGKLVVRKPQRGTNDGTDTDPTRRTKDQGHAND
jgi:hypothetical protein